MLRELATGLVDLVYPPTCSLCGRLLGRHAPFCDECRIEVSVDPFPACERCGCSVGQNLGIVSSCPRCDKDHWAFDRVVRLGPYEGRRRDLILSCKSDECLTELAGALFADAIAEKLKVEPLDLVIPVPLFWHRRWRRGYNQSEVFARALAKAIQRPMATKVLRRIRPTQPQTRLSHTARRENVRGAFRARKQIRGTVVLVDDVLTTGATAGEAAQAVKRVGATRVIVAVVAHG